MPYNKSIIIVGGLNGGYFRGCVQRNPAFATGGITSQRAAAKRLGISRNAVKKYWEGNAVPRDRKAYSREAVMTPEVVQFITECLDGDDRERIKKQRHTARRIYERLAEERGFPGSESSVETLSMI